MKKRKLGTFSKFNTGLPNQESAGQILEKGVMFMFKCKQNEKPDKASQSNWLHFVLPSTCLQVFLRDPGALCVIFAHDMPIPLSVELQILKESP